MAPGRDTPGLEWADVSAMAAELPGVEEYTAWGTPALRIRKRFLGRLRPEGGVIVLRIDPMEREALMQMQPETFFVTPHYEPWPQYVLIRLSSVDPQELRELVTEAWRAVAPKRMVREFDGAGGGD